MANKQTIPKCLLKVITNTYAPGIPFSVGEIFRECQKTVKQMPSLQILEDSLNKLVNRKILNIEDDHRYSLNEVKKRDQSKESIFSVLKGLERELKDQNPKTILQLTEALQINHQRIRITIDILRALGIIREIDGKAPHLFQWDSMQEQLINGFKDVYESLVIPVPADMIAAAISRVATAQGPLIRSNDNGSPTTTISSNETTSSNEKDSPHMNELPEKDENGNVIMLPPNPINTDDFTIGKMLSQRNPQLIQSMVELGTKKNHIEDTSVEDSNNSNEALNASSKLSDIINDPVRDQSAVDTEKSSNNEETPVKTSQRNNKIILRIGKKSKNATQQTEQELTTENTNARTDEISMAKLTKRINDDAEKKQRSENLKQTKGRKRDGSKKKCEAPQRKSQKISKEAPKNEKSEIHSESGNSQREELSNSSIDSVGVNVSEKEETTDNANDERQTEMNEKENIVASDEKSNHEQTRYVTRRKVTKIVNIQKKKTILVNVIKKKDHSKDSLNDDRKETSKKGKIDDKENDKRQKTEKIVKTSRQTSQQKKAQSKSSPRSSPRQTQEKDAKISSGKKQSKVQKCKK
ncbi:hypothetical protein TRFO_24756 [Tritrichomonas foetus]|uniref:Uncharacterized protein n=1 Tax=Tritrichomonas foetus TaxID=1144522 RepID=A0A1J4KBG3_9EUKA|nr:hypothetical protein TRFO_24756 [Tritrichomonas foetus]|eukprot:OHT07030.1 hypothetical protein TRFO_24756 [Tritrichomonas foetus]